VDPSVEAGERPRSGGLLQPTRGIQESRNKPPVSSKAVPETINWTAGFNRVVEERVGGRLSVVSDEGVVVC
jgi:hypothetical protein